MSRFDGADVDQLDDFGVACAARGNRISTLVSDLGPRALDESVWTGEDADEWRRTWRALAPRLRDLAALLRIAGNDARDQTEQQNRASSADGFAGGTSSGRSAARAVFAPIADTVTTAPEQGIALAALSEALGAGEAGPPAMHGGAARVGEALGRTD